jgi:hypothetical protein
VHDDDKLVETIDDEMVVNGVDGAIGDDEPPVDRDAVILAKSTLFCCKPIIKIFIHLQNIKYLVAIDALQRVVAKRLV